MLLQVARLQVDFPVLGSEVLNPDSGLWYSVAVILRSPVCAPGWSKKITEIRKSKFMRPRVGVT